VQLEFPHCFFGSRTERTVVLHNSGPLEAWFTMTHGDPADMAARRGAGAGLPAAAAGEGGEDSEPIDRCAGLLA
jgi:hypothetical protein